MEILKVSAGIYTPDEEEVRSFDFNMRTVVELFKSLPDTVAYEHISRIIECELVYLDQQDADEFRNELKQIRSLASDSDTKLIDDIVSALSLVEQDQMFRVFTMHKEHETTVALMIYCDANDPQEITDYIGMEPDETAKAGNRRIRYTNEGREIKLPIKVSLWGIRSSLADSEDAEEHIKHLLERCRPYKRKIIETAGKYGGPCISVGMYSFWFNPQFVFDAAILKELGEYGARLYLDIYDFSESDDE